MVTVVYQPMFLGPRYDPSNPEPSNSGQLKVLLQIYAGGLGAIC